MLPTAPHSRALGTAKAVVTSPSCRSLTSSCMQDLGPTERSCCSLWWAPSECPPEPGQPHSSWKSTGPSAGKKGALLSGAIQASLARLWHLDRWEMAPDRPQHHHWQEPQGPGGSRESRWLHTAGLPTPLPAAQTAGPFLLVPPHSSSATCHPMSSFPIQPGKLPCLASFHSRQL